MLGLLTPTDPSWIEAVENDLPGLLMDHAHCELKAAQSALSIVARFGGEYPALVEPLTDLAQEEARHFAEVHREMTARGIVLGSPEQDAYVNELRTLVRQAGGSAPPLLDRLLLCALIEARSCERFRLLRDRLQDAALGHFYGELMASEARHYRLFCGLAESCFGVEAARARMRLLAQIEGTLSVGLPLGPTVHG
ncbi:MAG: tRNA-(ms[2]io[6]A)-hydroxylase [Myxococcales bacterium]|nr:tRNA-(ms[2]io[6]A)-hydroxylase [Myxococcales bacterium]